MTVRVRINKFFGNYNGANKYLKEYLATLRKVSNANSARENSLPPLVQNFKNHIKPRIEALQNQYNKLVKQHRSGNNGTFLKALQVGHELGLLKTYWNASLTNAQVRSIAGGQLARNLGRLPTTNLTRFRSSAYSGRA
jgi:hypothetical protein